MTPASDFMPEADDIRLEQQGMIRPMSKVAYCFSTSHLHLIISNSGHYKILRGRDKADFDFGGWCDLKTGRLWATNGTVSNVPPAWRNLIQRLSENHFRVNLSWRD